ncbi:dihydrofolate reductase [Candidatus Saccharibacteria bacterium]|nr:dihydrofolate reductase [Candidatus Saccharibacteria bacterium]
MLSIIASMGENREIGVGKELAFKGRGELPYVKETTMGRKLLMGRATYESLPKRLVGREYFVLDFEAFLAPEWVNVVTDLAEFVKAAKYGGEIDVVRAGEPGKAVLAASEEIFVFGGASLYRQTLADCDKLYLTEVQAKNEEADVFFPELDERLYSREEVGRGEYDDGTEFVRYIYTKRK